MNEVIPFLHLVVERFNRGLCEGTFPSGCVRTGAYTLGYSVCLSPGEGAGGGDGSLALDASALEQGTTLSWRLAAQQVPQQQGHRRDGVDPTALTLLPQGLVLLHPSVERRGGEVRWGIVIGLRIAHLYINLIGWRIDYLYINLIARKIAHL